MDLTHRVKLLLGRMDDPRLGSIGKKGSNRGPALAVVIDRVRAEQPERILMTPLDQWSQLVQRNSGTHSPYPFSNRVMLVHEVLGLFTRRGGQASGWVNGRAG
jgi:hypothetical protein